MSELHEVILPDIGETESADVVELLVAPGDHVEVDQSILVLESDKATMEVPSPVAGVIEELSVALGDQVAEGARLAVVRMDEGAAAPEPPAAKPPEPEVAPVAREDAPIVGTPNALAAATETSEAETAQLPRPVRAHASPSVRQLARELGVDLALVPGTGRKGRVSRDDVQQYVKASLGAGTGHGVPIAGVAVAAPLDIDFTKFGETELAPLHRIRKLSSANLHRSWVTVPHVTQFDEADITDLDAFRRDQKGGAAARGVVSPVP